MRLKDTRTGYGWISIVLHWVTAAFVLTMLFVGNSIPSVHGGAYQDKLRLHVGLAFIFYLFMWFRIWWRFAKGHPAPLPKQRGFFFYVGKYTHFGLILALALMLVSGPLMASSGGFPLAVFDWFTIPPLIDVNVDVFTVAHFLHVAGATILGWGAFLHICGSAKHFLIDNDGTLDKMLVAAAPEADDPAAPEPPAKPALETPGA